MTDLRISVNKVFYKIFSHIIGSVRYNYGLNYLFAAALTYVIVESGLDWAWHGFSAAHIWIFYGGFVSVIAGMFLPIIIPLCLYLSKDRFKKIIGLALGQAAILGFTISTFIKLFTGRMPPEFFAGSLNNSAGFQFGFYRGGWFNGWPSSHTTVAFAMAIALTQLYPNSRAVKIGAWIYAILIGLGVSLNIHWLSDAVAGGLIGYAIGKSTGRGFKNIQFRV